MKKYLVLLAAVFLAGCSSASSEVVPDETAVPSAVTESAAAEPSASSVPELHLSSQDLSDGVWNSVIASEGSGQNLSPELSFDAVEGAEDDPDQGWKDILAYNPGPQDCLVGITASGSAPYVVGAIRKANGIGMLTASISCNEESPVARESAVPIIAVVGPEFVTGSTRMKSGTATKLILNMISTSVMIRLGRVKGNRMVDMQLTNKKLVDRGTRMIMDETGISDYEVARELLFRYGSVRAAINSIQIEK